MFDDEPTEQERFEQGIAEATSGTKRDIILKALKVERIYYGSTGFWSNSDLTNPMYDLRKALEGIWGHDLPDLEKKDE